MGIHWYVTYPLSTRRVEDLMEERGVDVDHAIMSVSAIAKHPISDAPESAG